MWFYLLLIKDNNLGYLEIHYYYCCQITQKLTYYQVKNFVPNQDQVLQPKWQIALPPLENPEQLNPQTSKVSEQPYLSLPSSTSPWLPAAQPPISFVSTPPQFFSITIEEAIAIALAWSLSSRTTIFDPECSRPKISWGLVRFICSRFTWFARWFLGLIFLVQQSLLFLIRRRRFRWFLQRSFGNGVDFLGIEEIGKQPQRLFSIDRMAFVEAPHSPRLCAWLSYNEKNRYMQVSKAVFDSDYPHGRYATASTKSHKSQ